MITEVVALEHHADEPVLALHQDRNPAVAFAPLAQIELVDLVARPATEQLGEVLGRGGNEVDRYLGSLHRHAAGAVGGREAEEEAGRLDAALCREPDQAASSLTAGTADGGDEHRVVQVAHQRVELVPDAVPRRHRW